MDHRVQRVIALMKANLRRGLTLGEMAQAADLTPSHFCRLFKAETGGTPAKYLKWLKMQKAKELLETTTLGVKQVMLRLGVKDKSHFVRDFEMTSGLTPTKYRAHYLSGDLENERAKHKKAKSATK